MDKVPDIIRPGFFSKQIAADSRRLEFDYKNEVLVANRVPVDFVFFGDSITHIWELKAYFGKPGMLVINRGIGGDTTEYGLKRFEADVLQLKPRYVVVLMGVNNLWAVSENKGQGTQGRPTEELLKEVTADIEKMYALASDNGIGFILCSILPTNTTYVSEGSKVNDLILDINNWFKNFAKAKNILYTDYHSQLAAEDGRTLKDGFSHDGVHPHVLGYNVMAEVLKKALKDAAIEI